MQSSEYYIETNGYHRVIGLVLQEKGRIGSIRQIGVSTVGLNDFLDQRVPDNIGFIQIEELDSRYRPEDFSSLAKP